MNVVLGGSDPRELLTHLASYGCGAIAESQGHDVTLAWTAGMDPRPVLHGIDELSLGTAVAEHARQERAWLVASLPHQPTRALFSPRNKPPSGSSQWRELQLARQSHLDTLMREHLDLRFIGSLGEPAYWYINQQKAVEPDRGATRFEMQPRNQGSEFVGTRLRPLASAVRERSAQEIIDGLVGRALVDELGGKPDSRSAVNLRHLGPADSALVWVALWGMSVLPVVHLTPIAHARGSVSRQSRTAGHCPRVTHGESAGAFALPMWEGPWTPARLRHVLSSAALAEAGRALSEGVAAPDLQRSWLTDRGIRALMRFPIATVGSTSAPERRALPGQLCRL